MGKRGLFAEIQHQQRLAEQRQRREHAAAVQAYNRAVREQARAEREYEREIAAAQRFQARSTAESIRAEKALKAANAQVQTAQAVDALEQIDSILASTLEVDDYVDIDSLKQMVHHPPFQRDDLKPPVQKPPMAEPPPEPQFVRRPHQPACQNYSRDRNTGKSTPSRRSVGKGTSEVDTLRPTGAAGTSRENAGGVRRRRSAAGRSTVKGARRIQGSMCGAWSRSLPRPIRSSKSLSRH